LKKEVLEPREEDEKYTHLHMINKNTFRFIFSVLLAQSAGVIGSFFTAPAISTWYETLTKPVFTPPGWVFGPVWILLYTVMGVALYLVWRHGLKDKRIRFAFMFFLVHLMVNASWSIVFFGLHNPLYGLFIIVLLWLMIALSTILFWRIDNRAGYLLVPYLLWVSFAAVLNYSIWLLN